MSAPFSDAQVARLLDALRRAELTSFIEGAMNVLASAGPYLSNYHIAALGFALQGVFEGRTKRLLITLPPRHLKSIAASVCFPAWTLGRAPRTRLVCISHTAELATQHHNDCRRLIQSPYYQRLFGACRIARSKNTEVEFRTTFGGGRLSLSVGGPITGRGGEIVIIDDPLKADDAASDTKRKAVNTWFANTIGSRLNDPRTGAIIVVMQRLHEDDLAGALLDQGGWTHLNLPAIAETDERVQIGSQTYHLRREGELLHAERVSAETLTQLRRELGEDAFSAQYQQRPAPREGAIIKRAWLGRYVHTPERRPGDQIVQCWDMGVKAGPQNDYSVCVTVLKRGRQHFILHVLRDRWEFATLLKRVVDHRRQYGPGPLLIEDAAAGAQVIQALRADPKLPRAIALKPDSDKVSRLAGQSYKFEAGDVLAPESAPWLGEFETELLAFPKSRHDDQVDAIAHYLRWSDRHQSAPLVSGGEVFAYGSS